ncbi:FAD binding domain protein [Colletotrichum camelliae]|nr:FAD binding domain protein [Colletotrichum camelliae]
MTFRVVIVGGSVAGLALANMLEKFDIDYVVLEAYPDIAPQVGASIGLLPNGLRILDQLGCYDAYRAKAEDQIYQHAYLREPSGKAYGYQHDLMEMWEKMLGYPMIFIDRQMLIQVLYSNLRHKERVLTSKRAVSVEILESSAQVTTKNGEVFSGDIVVGADGIHSTVRKEMWRNAPPGYFPHDEYSKVPATTLCIFGISDRPQAYPGASQHNTLSEGHSYYVMAAPGNRVYWFLFMELKETLYGENIPRYTKDDEAKIVKQHLEDRILENMTFGDLYDKRIVTTLAPLQTYVFKKWHYKRLVTIGDSAHKVDPVTGQGGNGAIESGALLVNALLRKFDSSPDGLSEKQVEDVLAEVHAIRFERAQDVVQQGYWLQNAFTQRSTMGKLIARYFMPALGSFGVLYRGVEFCSPATSLHRLEIPHRPRAVPFEDELPARPVKNLGKINKLASIAATTLLCALAAGLVRLPKSLELTIDALCSTDVATASNFPAVTFLVNTASLLAMALVESNRVGNKITSWVQIVTFALVNSFLGPGAIGPLAALFAHWSCGLIVGRHVPVEAAKMVLPIVAVGYVLPAAIAMLRMDSSSITIWRNAPIICFMLARSLSALGNSSSSVSVDDEKSKLKIERERTRNMFAKADLPHIRLVHCTAFIISAAVHLINVFKHGLHHSLTLGGNDATLLTLGFSKYEGMIFTLSSLLLALGAAPLSLRLSGYITDFQCLTSAIIICEYRGRPGDAVNTPSQTLQPLFTELDQHQAPQTLDSLSEQIRKAIVHTEHKTSFLPLDALHRILAIEGNLAPLQQCVRGAGSREGALGEVQSFVFNNSASGSPSVTEQRAPGSGIFAVLLLIEKPQEIEKFLLAGLSDEDLPFQFPIKDGVRTIKTKRDESVEHVFCKWAYLEIENFSKHQWTVLSPFFRKPDNGNPDNVYHYDLQPEMILPFQSSTEGPNTDSGSYGTVFKVRMHPAHCDFDPYENRDLFFGVKRLKKSDGVAFKKEVDTLKRFSVNTSKHLIQLLATYRYQNNYYLIFPWADSNLQGLWESIKNPPHSLNLSLWVARQCHGLAVGLSNIHVYQSQPENDLRVPSLVPTSHEKPFGRHNDIKHENVLWFRDNSKDAEDYAGQLKISDFGFVNFNSEGSRSIVPNQALFTPTYRPPECAVPNHTISRALDLWSLGCLYLEFVTWLLKGYAAATDDFTDKRLSEGQHSDVKEFQDDNFFTMESGVLSLKPSVIKCMMDLHMDPHCTPYLHDFLDCIADHLLVPNPAGRISCAKLVCKLGSILQKCEENPEYCTKDDPRSDHAIPPASRQKVRLGKGHKNLSNMEVSGAGTRTNQQTMLM